jgi:enediyne biosynthesis protein E4
MHRHPNPGVTRALTAAIAALAVTAWTPTGEGTQPAEPRFVPGSGSAVSERRGPSRGVAWGDFDGDGDPDLYVTRSAGSRNTLYRNDRGTFVPLDESPVSRDLGDSEGAVFVDFDGDGNLDLHVVGRNGGGSKLFRNDSGAFSPVDLFPEIGSASMACWTDVDGDGWLDVFFVGYRTEGNRLFRSLEGRAFRELPLPAAVAGSGAGRACGWSATDGYPMLAIANASQPNAVVRFGAAGSIESVAGAHVASDRSYSYGVSWADVDGDGRQDLFVANYDAGNVLYLTRHGPRLEAGAIGEVLQGPASKGHAWGDYDLDGRLDLYLGNGTPRPGMFNQLYLRSPTGFRHETSGAFTRHDDISAGVAWADYDGDGDLDLFVANWGSPEAVSRLYRNTTDSRPWIAFDLRQPGPNTRALGARVSIEVEAVEGSPRWLHRWIEAGTGYAGQNETMVHFGLGGATAVRSVRVTWPDGTVQDCGSFRGGRRVTLERDRCVPD